ncbi:universal stress protein [Actinacidiphila bryophytorum]|uniref:Nucleotide-binding universal stress protein, UspA family n=1 Tax=Actinacidiphila bryophytorum TaxID=1436133 RepID=A0A9W4GX23_9ACTN|nr:universal stress protein [Actinacidiphila bryophytorum]MBM9438405.1 universal stress protein [Actinacidiphila bryophytorum]MBN6542321.1 universal stress protein [Actinacidiphila bryophytorum]CAG7613950.1 Nucleotide-binding universal stress protein, UspA family [Actinacidiphila bryophytorum]
MRNPLIVGIDGSDPSLLAIDWAIAEAARHDLPLRLVYGSLWERYEAAVPEFGARPPAEHLLAEHIVASAAQRAGKVGPGLEVSTALVPAGPVDALLAEGEGAFAIVVGTRGRGGITGMLLGSTSLEVAARARCPVVVVRGAESNVRGELSRVTVGVHPDGRSAAAVAFAAREAQVRKAELLALGAWRRPARELPGTGHLAADASDPQKHDAEQALGDALRTVAQKYPQVTVHGEAVEGRARNALLDASARSDLLVVGARRRSGSVGMQLSPVNHAVLHHCACPVAVVPQEG